MSSTLKKVHKIFSESIKVDRIKGLSKKYEYFIYFERTHDFSVIEF